MGLTILPAIPASGVKWLCLFSPFGWDNVIPLIWFGAFCI